MPSALGELALGIVDPDVPGVAEGISKLLMRSIQDARVENDGHLPSWLVDDIERNYISPAKIRSLWAATGHRFVVTLADEIIGTIHIAKRHDVILTIDRTRINVPASEHPGFKPHRYHHVVNISVKHELRRAKIGTAMVDAIVAEFRDLFDGDGLWVRADPPWHPGLAGLRFVHDPSMDVFLPEDAERTADLPHHVFNHRYACDCPAPPERAALMATKKLQYVSLARPFERPPLPAKPHVSSERAPLTADPHLTIERAPLQHALSVQHAPISIRTDTATRQAHATDFGAVHHSLPRAVATPTTIDALAALLSQRHEHVTIRGAGQSTEGQSLGDDLVVSTAALDHIAVETSRVTVQGGVTWRKLLGALGDSFPPVVPGWTEATLGGSLATCGFGKGSHRDGTVADHVLSLLVVTGDGRQIRCSPTQAAWLFDAVLGGFGAFGVIAEATLRLVPRRPCVTITRSPLASIDTLPLDGLHAMAFHHQEGFTAVRVDESDAGIPLRDYLLGNTDVPPPPRAMFQVFVAPEHLVAVTDVVSRHLHDFVVHPIRSGRPGALVPVVAPQHTIFYAISVLGPPTDAHVTLANEVARLGARTTLFGVLPEDNTRFTNERLLRTKRMADPRHVLGAPRLRFLF